MVHPVQSSNRIFIHYCTGKVILLLKNYCGLGFWLKGMSAQDTHPKYQLVHFSTKERKHIKGKPTKSNNQNGRHGLLFLDI